MVAAGNCAHLKQEATPSSKEKRSRASTAARSLWQHTSAAPPTRFCAASSLSSSTTEAGTARPPGVNAPRSTPPSASWKDCSSTSAPQDLRRNSLPSSAAPNNTSSIAPSTGGSPPERSSTRPSSSLPSHLDTVTTSSALWTVSAIQHFSRTRALQTHFISSRANGSRTADGFWTPVTTKRRTASSTNPPVRPVGGTHFEPCACFAGSANLRCTPRPDRLFSGRFPARVHPSNSRASSHSRCAYTPAGLPRASSAACPHHICIRSASPVRAASSRIGRVSPRCSG